MHLAPCSFLPKTSSERPGQRLLFWPDLSIKSRSLEPSLKSSEGCQGWAQDSLFDTWNGSLFFLLLTAKTLLVVRWWLYDSLSNIKLEIKGCGWQISHLVLVKNAGISGNLEPNYYRWLTDGSLTFLNSCTSSWRNGIPELTGTVRAEVLAWQMRRSSREETEGRR